MVGSSSYFNFSGAHKAVTNRHSGHQNHGSEDQTIKLPSIHSVFRTLYQVLCSSKQICCCCCQLLQSYPTLCDPTDGSPPGSSIPGILQARILEWVAISFSIQTNLGSRYYHAQLQRTKLRLRESRHLAQKHVASLLSSQQSSLVIPIYVFLNPELHPPHFT